jgi:hypothetical protein
MRTSTDALRHRLGGEKSARVLHFLLKAFGLVPEELELSEAVLRELLAVTE